MEVHEVTIERLSRRLKPEELVAIAYEYCNHIRSEGTKDARLAPLVLSVSASSIYRSLEELDRSGNLEVYICGRQIIGILGYTIASPWWSERKYLEELCVFTIADNFKGFGRKALERFEQLAIENDCMFVATGSAFNSKVVENLYMKKGGYQYNYPGYVKVLLP